MFINSIKPDNIPNCFLWWDFSDLSTITTYDKAFPIIQETTDSFLTNPYFSGSSIIDGDEVRTCVDKIQGVTMSTYSPFDDTLIGGKPTIIFKGINGLPSLGFGQEGQTTYNQSICTWPAGPDSNHSDTVWNPIEIKDSERTIFIVYKFTDASHVASGLNSVTSWPPTNNDSFSFTNLPTGDFSTVMSLFGITNTQTNDSPILYEGGSISLPVSVLNLLKYSTWDSSLTDYSATNYLVCNYIPVQGFTLSIPDTYGPYLPNNIFATASDIHKVRENFSDNNMFVIRTKEASATGSSVLDITDMSSKNNTIYKNKVGNLKLNGVVGLNQGLISLGAGSRPSYTDGQDPTNAISWAWDSDTTLLSQGLDYHINRESGFCGLIGELIYYNRRLTDSETNQVKQYLTKKWGL